MAVANGFLSLEHFETLYHGQKPSVEYWFGEATAKSEPTLSQESTVPIEVNATGHHGRFQFDTFTTA